MFVHNPDDMKLNTQLRCLIHSWKTHTGSLLCQITDDTTFSKGNLELFSAWKWLWSHPKALALSAPLEQHSFGFNDRLTATVANLGQIPRGATTAQTRAGFIVRSSSAEANAWQSVDATQTKHWVVFCQLHESVLLSSALVLMLG